MWKINFSSFSSDRFSAAYQQVGSSGAAGVQQVIDQVQKT
jgi:hypothetical protein